MVAKMRKVTIDRFGRVLIPKQVRVKLGLTAGQELSLATEGERVILEPRAEPAAMIRKGRALVFAGELLEQDADWAARNRLERARQSACRVDGGTSGPAGTGDE